MNVSPASALAVWALVTAWLLLFFFLERFDPVVGEDLIDWIQAACAVLLLPFYPAVRRWFSAWLGRAKSQ